MARIEAGGWGLGIGGNIDRNPDRSPKHIAKRGLNITLLVFYHRLKCRR